jgi:Fur family transcriptional regulator, ferric uptake regulator
MSCEKTLKEKQFRLTPQRQMIIDILHMNSDHLSAEDIINYVQGHLPSVDKSTIYRNLDLLLKIGCVYKSESPDGTIYHHADEGHHHHLVCSKCNRTIDCEEDVFSSVRKMLKEKYGFQLDSKHIVLTGRCANCKDSR